MYDSQCVCGFATPQGDPLANSEMKDIKDEDVLPDQGMAQARVVGPHPGDLR